MNKIIFHVVLFGMVISLSCSKKANKSDTPEDQDPPTAKAPEIKWQKAFGGSEEERLTSIKQTSDGGYIIGGFAYSDDGDVPPPLKHNAGWILKLDESGNVLWQKKLSKGLQVFSSVSSVLQTTDGGYAVTLRLAYWGTTGHWFVKLDASGNIQWEKEFDESFFQVQQGKDGTYFAVSLVKNNLRPYTRYAINFFKLDYEGKIIWVKRLGGEWDNQPDDMSLQLTQDGRIMLAGYCIKWEWDGPIAPAPGFSFVEVSQNGDFVWKKSMKIENTQKHSIIQTKDGGYAVVGTILTGDQVNKADYLLVKLDQAGSVQWQTKYGGTGSEYPTCIYQTKDDGYIIAGHSNSKDGDVTGNHGGDDYWVVKSAPDGKLQWQKSLGGSKDERSVSILQTKDGGFTVGGSTNSTDGDVRGNHSQDWDIWIVKLGY